MPPEPSFAPTQIYVLLGLSLATLSWLLKPGERPLGIAGILAFAFVVVQAGHIFFHGELPLACSHEIHRWMVAAYILLASSLFYMTWREYKQAQSKPPKNPQRGVEDS